MLTIGGEDACAGSPGACARSPDAWLCGWLACCLAGWMAGWLAASPIYAKRRLHASSGRLRGSWCCRLLILKHIMIYGRPCLKISLAGCSRAADNQRCALKSFPGLLIWFCFSFIHSFTFAMVSKQSLHCVCVCGGTDACA